MDIIMHATISLYKITRIHTLQKLSYNKFWMSELAYIHIAFI